MDQDDWLTRWSSDNQLLCVSSTKRITDEIFHADSPQGRRDPICEFEPPDRFGLLAVGAAAITAAPGLYAYVCKCRQSILYAVESIR